MTTGGPLARAVCCASLGRQATYLAQRRLLSAIHVLLGLQSFRGAERLLQKRVLSMARGSSVCVPCPLGTYSGDVGLTINPSTRCRPGHGLSPAATRVGLCPLPDWQYSALLRTVLACQQCPAGRGVEGSAVRVACSVGTSSKLVAQSQPRASHAIEAALQTVKGIVLVPRACSRTRPARSIVSVHQEAPRRCPVQLSASCVNQDLQRMKDGPVSVPKWDAQLNRGNCVLAALWNSPTYRFRWTVALESDGVVFSTPSSSIGVLWNTAAAWCKYFNQSQLHSPWLSVTVKSGAPITLTAEMIPPLPPQQQQQTTRWWWWWSWSTHSDANVPLSTTANVISSLYRTNPFLTNRRGGGMVRLASLCRLVCIWGRAVRKQRLVPDYTMALRFPVLCLSWRTAPPLRL